MPNLSLRLKTIASLVPFGARVCDIGTDHGYLPIELKKSGVATHVIAADVNPSPLKNAAENIRKVDVSGIELRLCDGLSGIAENEVDTIIIAGIGGEVISGIIQRGINIAKSSKNIILQPTTSPEFLRKFLYSNGFKIEKEIPILENGKLYSIMLVSPAADCEVKEEYFYYIGKLTRDNPIGLMYIQKQLNRCRSCAESLEKIALKQEEYLYYKNIVSGIENYLSED